VFSDEVVIFVFVYAEKEFTVIAGDIILHRFTPGIEKRYAGVWQDLKVFVLVFKIRNALQRVVDHLQIGIFIHERVYVVITLAAFAIRGEETTIGAEQEDAKVIARAVHRLAEVFNDILAVASVNNKQVETTVSRVSIGRKVETSIFGYVRKHFVARSVDLGTQVADAREPSTRIHLSRVQVCSSLSIFVLTIACEV